MRVVHVLALGCVLGLLLPLGSHLVAESTGTVAWLIDLASHWQWLFLPGLLLSVSTAAWTDKRWSVLLLASPLPWLTASAQAPESAQHGEVLTVASANVNLGNRDTQPFADWLSAKQVDVVAVFEVSPKYARQLRTLADYPFRSIVPSDGSFGIALLSRHPILSLDVNHDSDGVAQIEARVRWRDQAVDVLAIHPMPPISPHFRVARDRKLDELTGTAFANGLPAIIAGDLNTTPWSSAFSGPTKHGFRRATGLTPTWPAAAPGMLGIPIDHVLVTPHWLVASSDVGPNLGSDHLPVLARLFLKGPVVRRKDSD
jgi:endonuclease/exonuclease/phosphatase (EEP) superfamily protein YafD